MTTSPTQSDPQTSVENTATTTTRYRAQSQACIDYMADVEAVDETTVGQKMHDLWFTGAIEPVDEHTACIQDIEEIAPSTDLSSWRR